MTQNQTLPADVHLPGCPILCPNCQAPFNLTFPVEPVYDLKTAAMLIPTSYHSLRRLINNRPDLPRRYRKYRQGCQVRLHRMLTAAEIVALRKEYFVYKNPDKTPREPTPWGS